MPSLQLYFAHAIKSLIDCKCPWVMHFCALFLLLVVILTAASSTDPPNLFHPNVKYFKQLYTYPIKNQQNTILFQQIVVLMYCSANLKLCPEFSNRDNYIIYVIYVMTVSIFWHFSILATQRRNFTSYPSFKELKCERF